MQPNTITSEVLPGLALRADAALARAQMHINPEVANEALFTAWQHAELLGFHAYKDGIYTPPAMIATDPDLRNGWECGQEAGLHFTEVLSCSHCKDLFHDDP